MNKTFFILLFSLCNLFLVSAKEGMWLPVMLQWLNEKEMQSMGMKITAEDIYSVNKASLKDAIVIFGSGCTGEVVSNEGLLLTNYHCGYSAIQRHSSIDHDYLTNGFWAMNKKEELYCHGLTVSFLIRMEEVTNAVLDNVSDKMLQSERNKIIEENIKALVSEVENKSNYHASVEEFYYGNQYFMFVYEVFKDIRLVGAPPSNIGKFGGDTDNWMWPRHTGDFSVFRIYADENNLPANYSKENKPYIPKNFLKISLDGVNINDFTFVFGYPGSTQEYLPAAAIKCVTEVENPISISVREKKLQVMNHHSDKDNLVRIQYANKIAGIANGWKKWIGESLGIKHVNGVKKRTDFEIEFQHWADTQANYSNILQTLNNAYDSIVPYKKAYRYFVEAGFGVEIVNFSRRFSSLVEYSKKKNIDINELNKILDGLKSSATAFFKDYCVDIDKELCPELLSIYSTNTAQDLKPLYFQKVEKKYNNNFSVFTDYLFDKSIFCDEIKFFTFINNYKIPDYKKIEKDPAYQLANGFLLKYNSVVYPMLVKYQNVIDSAMRFYMKAQMEFEKDKLFYPDANFTLRVAYGNVGGFSPEDGVSYNYFTTLEGILEKENPDIYDYVVEDKLRELYVKKDYGRYADKDGTMHVCFIASNHTTGGNSGSPVLNANGELIGLNFDRNWQGTMSDIMYDPDRCRNITLDIRYCLFIIDKFAGASHLLNEMIIL